MAILGSEILNEELRYLILEDLYQIYWLQEQYKIFYIELVDAPLLSVVLGALKYIWDKHSRARICSFK